MSRLGRPPLAGGSAVAAGKHISKLSRHALLSRRAVDCAKLLANLAGDRAGHPASLAAAPSTPSMLTSPLTRSERYALCSAEKSIDKMPAEHSSPNGAEQDPSAESASFVPGDVSEGNDCSSGGDQRMERQHRQREAALSAMAPLKPPPLEVVFQPPNDPGVKDVQVETQVTPATGVVANSVLDMAPLKPPPLEVVFQPPNNPGVKDVQVDTQVTPTTGVVADSVHDDMFNAWRCGSCTYQNLGKAKGHVPCAMTLIRFEQDCRWILLRDILFLSLLVPCTLMYPSNNSFVSVPKKNRFLG